MPAQSSARRRLTQKVVPARGTALLLIDVINDLSFEGSETMIPEAERMALRLARLKRRVTRAGIPVVYVNDNFGRWRSDFRHTVAHCTSPSSPGRIVSSRLRPTQQDYFVLKPKHSGFYGTTLEALLGELRVKRVIVTGIAGDICVLFTANDAYMRDLTVLVPCDCTVSNTPAENEHALHQIKKTLKGDVRASEQLSFTGRARRVRLASER